MVAFAAIRVNPVHVSDTLDPAGMLKVTLTNKIELENVDDELPEEKPHMSSPMDETISGGNVIVTVCPLTSALDMLKVNNAVPPEPTALDIINPVREGPKQPTHGAASTLTSKGVSLSKVVTSEKLETL